MFQVQKTEYANKTLRMPVELIKRLEDAAWGKNISLNKMVVQCCQYALDRLE